MRFLEFLSSIFSNFLDLILPEIKLGKIPELSGDCFLDFYPVFFFSPFWFIFFSLSSNSLSLSFACDAWLRTVLKWWLLPWKEDDGSFRVSFSLVSILLSSTFFFLSFFPLLRFFLPNLHFFLPLTLWRYCCSFSCSVPKLQFMVTIHVDEQVTLNRMEGVRNPVTKWERRRKRFS